MTELDGVYTQLWILWLLFFVAIEGTALANKRPGDTLTEHTKRWFSVGFKGTGWRGRRVALLSFLVWLLVHMVTDFV